MDFPLRALKIALPLTLIGATAAIAADPESGTIGQSSPKVEWKGTVVNSGVTNNAWAQDPSAPCEAPACDTFALTVADAGDVTVKLWGFKENTAGGDPGCGIRITFPDGSYQYTDGTCGPKNVMSVKLRGAKAGDYVVDVADSHVVSQPEDYTASAEMPAFAGAPAPATPAPAPAPESGQSPPAAQQPAPQLTIKASRTSARRVARKRRYAVTLSTSGPLTQVQARLLKGRKTVGRAKLARLEGTRKLTLKLSRKAAKRLRKGTYRVTATGVDAEGRRVTTLVKVRFKR